MVLSAPTAVIVPVLDRPHRVAPLVESFLASGAREATLYFVADADDHAEVAAIEAAAAEHEQVRYIITAPPLVTFARKANLGYRETTEDWLFFCGDDVAFDRGWLWKGLREASDRYSLVAVNDCYNPVVQRGRLANHPLIRRAWIDVSGASWDGPGHVAHEGYRHWYVDQEWTAKAMLEGVFTFARLSRVRHLHHLNGQAEFDATYRKGAESVDADRALFRERVMRFGEGRIRVP